MDTDESKRLGRRRALQVFGAGLSAVGGMILLESCKSNDSDAPAPAAEAPRPAAAGGGLNCQNQEPGDEAARQMRQTLQYKEKTNLPGKMCSNCSQFEAAKFGACGGCKLFGGAVNAGGICLSYAPIGAAPAPGAAPAAR